MPEVKVGIPSVIHAALMPRLIGMGRARWMILTGAAVDAAKALDWGLVDAVSGEAGLDAAVADALSPILECGPAVIAFQKALMREWEELSLSSAIEASVPLFRRAFRTGGRGVPCSVTDVVARIMADSLCQVGGKPVVVENRPGGSAVVGTMAAAGAAPDGYTLAMLTPTSADLNPHLLRRLSYDPIRDFAPVRQICECPHLLFIDLSLPARDLRKFLDLARQRPNEFAYSYGDQIGRAFRAALEQPVLQRRLAEQGLRPKGGSPEEWNALLRSELARWGGFVRDAGNEPQ